MEYFTRTKAGGIHRLHPHEVLVYLRRGHQTVYAAQALPPKKGGEPGFSWISCWVAPTAQEAVEIRLGRMGYVTWQLCIAELRVTWHPYRVTRSGIKHVQSEPKERIVETPITPGRIWVRVPEAAAQKFIDTHRNAYIEGFRVELDAQGNVPVVPAPRLPHEQKFGPVLEPGDVVYVPSKKIWGRVWNYVPTDKHYVEVGDLVCPRVSVDGKIRDQHRVGVVPVTACVPICEETSSSKAPEAPTQIAQKRGHAGGRWSTGQVAGM
jgi:hypothetical protein